MLAVSSYPHFQRENCAVGEDVEKLKQRLPLLDYLRQQSWTARPIAFGPEFVGFCPLHPETRPSFYYYCVINNQRRRAQQMGQQGSR
jgi:hypothetical protein